jgi:hypothetical protein
MPLVNKLCATPTCESPAALPVWQDKAGHYHYSLGLNAGTAPFMFAMCQWYCSAFAKLLTEGGT